jgi:hypothetical protein
VFDIQDLLHPREIAYFVAPPTARLENGLMPSDFAMSRPEFAPERREIWYTDGTSGFYALRLDKSAWPAAATPSLAVSRSVSRGRKVSQVGVVATFNHDGEGPMPVAGATITIGKLRAITNSAGDASLVVHSKTTTHVRLVVSAPGYQSVRATITVGRGHARKRHTRKRHQRNH